MVRRLVAKKNQWVWDGAVDLEKQLQKLHIRCAVGV